VDVGSTVVPVAGRIVASGRVRPSSAQEMRMILITKTRARIVTLLVGPGKM
jgi:hypothetical protein